MSESSIWQANSTGLPVDIWMLIAECFSVRIRAKYVIISLNIRYTEPIFRLELCCRWLAAVIYTDWISYTLTSKSDPFITPHWASRRLSPFLESFSATTAETKGAAYEFNLPFFPIQSFLTRCENLTTIYLSVDNAMHAATLFNSLAGVSRLRFALCRPFDATPSPQIHFVGHVKYFNAQALHIPCTNSSPGAHYIDTPLWRLYTCIPSNTLFLAFLYLLN